MFKNKKLPKIQILSLVVSLTIFVGGSFYNDVMGSGINVYENNEFNNITFKSLDETSLYEGISQFIKEQPNEGCHSIVNFFKKNKDKRKIKKQLQKYNKSVIKNNRSMKCRQNLSALKTVVNEIIVDESSGKIKNDDEIHLVKDLLNKMGNAVEYNSPNTSNNTWELIPDSQPSNDDKSYDTINKDISNITSYQSLESLNNNTNKKSPSTTNNEESSSECSPFSSSISEINDKDIQNIPRSKSLPSLNKKLDNNTNKKLPLEKSSSLNKFESTNSEKPSDGSSDKSAHIKPAAPDTSSIPVLPPVTPRSLPKHDTSLLDYVKSNDDNNLSNISSIVLLSPVGNNINERLYLFNNSNIIINNSSSNHNNNNLISSSGDNSNIK